MTIKKSQLLLALLVLGSTFLISEKSHASTLISGGNLETTFITGGSGTTSATYTTTDTGSASFIRVYIGNLIGTVTASLSLERTTDNARACGNRVAFTLIPNSYNDIPCDNNVINFTAGETYRFNFDAVGVPLGTDYNLSQLYFVVYDSGGISTDPAADATRIISLTSPKNGEATTTHVTFSGNYFLTDGYKDFDYGSFIAITITPKGFNIASSTTLHIPINASNTIESFSTSTTLLNNERYTWTAQIFCARTYDWFTTCDKTPNPGFLQFTTGKFDPTNGEKVDLSSCNLFNLDLPTCLISLIIPPITTLQTDATDLKDIVLNGYPLGYVTRFSTLLLNADPIKLPILTVKLPVGEDLTLDPWDKLMGTTSIIGQAHSDFIYNGKQVGSGLTLRQVVEPKWNDFWILVTLFVLVAESISISHIGWGFGDKGSLSDTSSTDDSYRLKETLYKTSYRGRGGYGPFQ